MRAQERLDAPSFTLFLAVHHLHRTALRKRRPRSWLALAYPSCFPGIRPPPWAEWERWRRGIEHGALRWGPGLPAPADARLTGWVLAALRHLPASPASLWRRWTRRYPELAGRGRPLGDRDFSSWRRDLEEGRLGIDPAPWVAWLSEQAAQRLDRLAPPEKFSRRLLRF